MQHEAQLVAIAYDLNFKHAAEIFSGASDYITTRGLNWQLLPLNFGFEPKLMELAKSERLSGAIGTFVSDEWLNGLRAYGVAAVNLFNFSKIERSPSIVLDNEAIGRIAATHLIEQGAKTLSFIGQDQAYFNQVRRKKFAETCPPGIYQPVSTMATRRRQIEQLRNHDYPIGILCSSDRVAREIVNEASLLGMDVGTELLVIGIGNEPTESTFAGIGLTSFEIPARRIGYLAAKQMEELLGFGDIETQPPIGEIIQARLIARESTLASPQARLTERANSLIAEFMAQADFDVAKLCRMLGASRRVLELATKRQLNKSPYQMISEERLSKAKELLSSTNQTIGKVGESCGYPEPHHFSAWFKKRANMSPRAFRTSTS